MTLTGLRLQQTARRAAEALPDSSRPLRNGSRRFGHALLLVGSSP